MAIEINLVDFLLTLQSDEHIFIFQDGLNESIWDGKVSEAVSHKAIRKKFEKYVYLSVRPDIDIIKYNTVATLNILAQPI